MENSLFSINNMRNMEVIDAETGTKLGFIKDFKINCDSCNVISVLIPVNKSNWLSKQEMIEIPWSDIIKVGVDVILVNGGGKNPGSI